MMAMKNFWRRPNLCAAFGLCESIISPLNGLLGRCIIFKYFSVACAWHQELVASQKFCFCVYQGSYLVGLTFKSTKLCRCHCYKAFCFKKVKIITITKIWNTFKNKLRLSCKNKSERQLQTSEGGRKRLKLCRGLESVSKIRYFQS